MSMLSYHSSDRLVTLILCQYICQDGCQKNRMDLRNAGPCFRIMYVFMLCIQIENTVGSHFFFMFLSSADPKQEQLENKIKTIVVFFGTS